MSNSCHEIITMSHKEGFCLAKHITLDMHLFIYSPGKIFISAKEAESVYDDMVLPAFDLFYCYYIKNI